jgi:hypothetical protein
LAVSNFWVSQLTTKRLTGLRARLAAWLVALPLAVACNVYSEDLLVEMVVSAGGVGTAGAAEAGSAGTGGATTQAQAGSGGTSPAGTGGAGGGEPTAGAGMGGHPDAVGGAPDVWGGAGAGGEPPASDACPNDPTKLEPGQCGCGVPESCTELKSGLAHRYSFNTAGSVAADTVGGANATIVGTTASAGKLTFDGTAATYLDLPNGKVSALKDASFEIWLTWGGGSVWQRIFDFGNNDNGEGNQGIGTKYLYLTPSEGATGNVLRAAFSLNGVGAETVLRGSAPLPTGSAQHLVLVIDDTKNQARLYLNGSVAAVTGFAQSLSSLDDVNNWVGRSNFTDTPLKGTIDEFRIYKVALTDAQVSASFGFGPNPAFL